MKTNDFIEEARDLGLFVEENKNQNMIWIKTPYEDNHVGEVKTNKIGCRIFDESKRFPGISRLIYEYGMTPLDERVEEKEYLIELINDVVKYNSNGSYLNLRVEQDQYLFSSANYNSKYKTRFTTKEIDSFPDDVKGILPLCKQIEVTQ